jgi:beta-mannosidase
VATTARANGSTLVLELPVAEALRGMSRERAVLEIGFEGEGAGAERRLLYFTLPKQLALPGPQLTVSVRPAADGWVADVRARSLARAVELQSDAPGRFEDNFFDLLAGETRSVRFLPDAAVTAPPTVSVRSLADVR